MRSVFSYPHIGIRMFRALAIPYNYNFNDDYVRDITWEEFLFKEHTNQLEPWVTDERLTPPSILCHRLVGKVLIDRVEDTKKPP